MQPAARCQARRSVSAARRVTAASAACTTPLAGGRTAIDRRADQRVPKDNPLLGPDKIPCFGEITGVHVDPEHCTAGGNIGQIAAGFGGGQQQPGLHVRRHRLQLPEVVRLQVAADGHGFGQQGQSDELMGGQLLREIDDGERVAVRRGDDLTGKSS